MSPATRRTTTIRRSHARDRFLLVLPGIVLLAGLVLILEGADVGDSNEPVFTSFVTPIEADTLTADAKGRERPIASPFNENEFSDVREIEETGDSLPRVAAGRYLIAIEDEDGRPVVDAKVCRVEIGRVAVASAPDGSTEVFQPFSREDLVTDARGELEFDASDRGNRLELVVDVEGYATKHYRLRDPGKRYALRLHRSASISGKVTDTELRPLSDITVELWHDNNRRLTTVTDENGNYDFKEVTPTTATLRIQDPHYKRARQHVVVVEGRIRYFRDFALEPGRHLDALVLDMQGAALDQVQVRLVELDSGLGCGQVMTDGSGRASFDCLSADRSYMAVAYSARLGGGRALVTPLGDLDADSVTIVTRPFWTYSGIVRTQDGVPLPDTQIIIESAAFDGSSSTSKEQYVVMTDAEGRFYVPGLDPTLDYAALIYHQQFAMQQIEQIEVPVASDDAGDSSPSEGERQEPDEIILGPASAMEGFIEGPDGDPLADTIIYLSNSNDHLRSLPGGQISVRTDGDGHFFIGNLSSGSYNFEARHLSSGLATPPLELLVGSGETINKRYFLREY